MSDNPQLKTPGEMISEARQAQDLTLAQLSERTKIPPGVLASLEMDEFHKISGPLYIKSFLRTCAVDLGLDPQIVLSLYNQISGENTSRPVGSEMVWEEEKVQVSRVGLPWLRIVLAAGVVAVLIGVGLFNLRGCGNGESDRDDGAHPAVGQTEPEETAVLVVRSDSVAGEESRHESLMTTSTEEELRQRVVLVEEQTNEPDDGPVSPSFVPDSLAFVWILSSDTPFIEDDESVPAPVDEVPAETESVEVVVPAQEMEKAAGDPVQDEDEILSEESSTDETPVEIVEEPSVESTKSPREVEQEKVVIEGPRTADPVVARMDSSWPLVLSISCDTQQGILVKRDGDREFSEVRWPREPEGAPTLPAAGFEAGRAYRQGDRLVVFWGADDHFSLKLAKVRGVEVSINGIIWNSGGLTVGQEYILDEHSVSVKPRP
ncbi:MAG: helix-turn-helix domain-containing protein [Candidatus Krumholzibacteria bacterium]|nr:helix-turn-helix domain-containing protein [Candidatus Krumholzibacteria bacterium]